MEGGIPMIPISDKVVIDESSWDTVYNWGLAQEVNKRPLPQIKHALTDFLITFCGNSDMFFNVRVEGDNQLNIFTVHSGYIVDYFNLETVNGVSVVNVSDEYEEIFHHFTPGADYNSYCQDMAFFITSLIVYMAEYREVKERIRKVNKISNSKKQHPKKRTKQAIKIGVYYINDYQASPEKKDRQKHVESWSVRGHWRNLKSGMKTWIAQHVKGDGVREAKEYRLE